MWLVAQRRGGARHGRSQFLGTRFGALAGGPAPGLGWGMRRVRRRAPLVLTALALAAGAGVAASAPGDAPVPTTFPTVQGRPFAQPPVLRSRHGVLATTLTVTPTTYRVAGTPILGKAYDRSFIGPTMRLRPGDTIRLRFRNELAQPTNIHFHGFHTSPSGISDNVLRVIPAHSTQPVVVKVPPDMAPGTYWYHSHEHGSSEVQVMDGLSGVIVVTGETRLLPGRLRGITERVFALKDLQAKDGAAVTENLDSGAATTRTVNGEVDPHVAIRPGETQLWRLANISADIWYRLRADGLRFAVVGEDANPTARVATTRTLLLPPGKRYDVLVQGPRRGTYRLRALRRTAPARPGTTTPSAGLRPSSRPAPPSRASRCRAPSGCRGCCARASPRLMSTAGGASSSARAPTATRSSSTASSSTTTASTSASCSERRRSGRSSTPPTSSTRSTSTSTTSRSCRSTAAGSARAGCRTPWCSRSTAGS